MNSFDKELRVIFKLYNLERYYFEEATKDIKLLISKYAPKEKPMTGDDLKCNCDGDGYCDCNFSENEGYNLYRAELFREMGIK